MAAAHRGRILPAVLHLILATAVHGTCPAADFTAANAKQFRNALAAAQTNGEDDVIILLEGIFNAGTTPFSYESPMGNGALVIRGQGPAKTEIRGGSTHRAW